jgi:hypothetical protein
MEIGLKNYIRNMFAMDSTPNWDSSFEGVIFYDKTARKWVVGNNEGWQELDRDYETVPYVTPIDWIDPFEYNTDEYLKSKWKIDPESILAIACTTDSTYGNYSMRADILSSGTESTTSGSIYRYFDPPLNFDGHNILKFDTKSSIVGKNIEVSFINDNELLTITNPNPAIEKTINHNLTNNWQTETINITNSSGSYDKCSFNILNFDEDYSFYIDSMTFGMPYVYWVDSFEYTSDENLRDNYLVTYSGTEVNLWTPSEITTDLWLDAADSDSLILDTSDNVEQWNDKSGNDRHPTQSNSSYRPTVSSAALNGLDALSFNGTSDVLAGVWSLPDTFQVVFVAKQTGQTSYRSIVRPVIGASSTGGSDDPKLIFIGPQRDSENLDFGCGTTRIPLVTGSWGIDETLVVSAHYDGSTLSGWKNGSLYGTVSFSESSLHPLCIGGDRSEFTERRFGGLIGEIIIVPMTEDRQKIEGYLAHKWGLEGNLPSDHPYKSTVPVKIKLKLYTDTTSPTYGNKSLKATIENSNSKGYSIGKDFDPYIPLSGYNTLSFDTKSSRVGSNIEFNAVASEYSKQESNTTTTVSKTIHHNDINTWQKERTDITYLIGSGLLYLKSIAFNILNDDSDNTFYLDNMYLSNDNKN